MQIKAQGLLNAAKFIEDEYGRDALGTVVRACGPAVRDRYTSAIAINWHPMEELVEFVQKADEILGRGNLKVAEAIGAAGARANMKGVMVRIAFYIAQPQFFIRRVAGLWRQFNDEGEMLVHSLDEHSGTMEIRGVSTPHAVFCAILTGWIREIATGIGIRAPTVRHTECVARGDARCFYDVRWATIEETKAAKAALEGLAREPPTTHTKPPPAPSPAASARPPPSSAAHPTSSSKLNPASAVLPPSSGSRTLSSRRIPTTKKPRTESSKDD